VAEILLSGRATRWDYASLDPAAHRLYLAHMGDGVVTVVDTQQRKVIGDIPDTDDVHGVLVVPQLGRVYATATGTNEVVAIDPKTLKILARAPAGDYPDGLAYAPGAKKLYVSDEHGGIAQVSLKHTLGKHFHIGRNMPKRSDARHHVPAHDQAKMGTLRLC